jgi:A/G-specific adenine glycosylase
LVRQRTGRDIWQSLYDFYLNEADSRREWTEEKVMSYLRQNGIDGFVVESISQEYSQQLTHQNIKGCFILIALDTIPPALQHFQLVEAAELASLPFPKFINQYLKSFY